MKHLFKYFSLIMMITVMSMSFSSCKDDKDNDVQGSTSIVGRWECSQQDEDESFKMILTFKSDNTGSIEEVWTTRASSSFHMNFSWSTTTDSDGDTILKVSYVSGDKETELFYGTENTVLWSRQYVLTGNILNIYQGEGVWVFKRI